jgi:hypothetical protein
MLRSAAAVVVLRCGAAGFDANSRPDTPGDGVVIVSSIQGASAMSSFAEALHPGRVAVRTVWLLQQKPVGENTREPAVPEKAKVRDADSPGAWSFALESRRLLISHDGQQIGEYVFSDARILRPYFANLRTLQGEAATRAHPPAPGSDATDHDTMHPGVWYGFGDISGNDFWRNRSRIQHEQFSTRPAVTADGLSFATVNTLFTVAGQSLSRMTNRIQLRTCREGYWIDWSVAFSPQQAGFYFGDQEEMGFGVRMATPLTEKSGGVILSSTGAKSAKDTWGKAFDWCDYSGELNGRRIGIAILADPANFRPSWFHNRDYGVFVANPFGRSALASGEPSRVEVRPNERFEIRYGALVHSSPADRPPDIARIFKEFTDR